MKSRIIKLWPGAGQIQIARDIGSFGINWERDGSAMHALGLYKTNLRADLFHRGKHQGHRDLGSGLVTNVGALSMANDFAKAGVSGAPVNLLSQLKYHSSGTGATAAAMTDIILQTPITTIASAVATGTQVLTPAANLQKYVSVATITYDAAGPYAVTEWGLFNRSVLSVTTGTPFTATSATSFTATGTPYTASSTTVQGQQDGIVRAGTTDAYGLILSNTTSVGTLPAWYKATDGTLAATPGGTEAFTIRPVMWDHKVFAAINVSNGDAIQFTYTLTMTAGG